MILTKMNSGSWSLLTQEVHVQVQVTVNAYLEVMEEFILVFVSMLLLIPIL